MMEIENTPLVILRTVAYIVLLAAVVTFHNRLERIAVAIETQNALTGRLATVETKCQEQERALHTLGMIARAELEAAKELNERMKRGR